MASLADTELAGLICFALSIIPTRRVARTGTDGLRDLQTCVRPLVRRIFLTSLVLKSSALCLGRTCVN